MPLRDVFFPADDEKENLPLRVLIPAFVGGCLFVLAPLPRLLTVQDGVSAMLASSFVSPAAGIVLMAALLVRSGGWQTLRIRPPDGKDLRCCLAGTCLVIATCAAVNALWKLLLKDCGIPYAEEQALMVLAKNIHGMDFVLLALLVTIPVPIAEELLFRRILYALLLPAGRGFAVIACAAVFSAVHLYLAGIPGLFIVGAGFQLLYLRRKNLAVSILCHLLFNACAVAAAAFAAD
ncbi:MAG: CPBP family intramembrane metalloprotease [Lentisphaeria bacterium]|nr:CPBP family intramembrane metalloprotease [Lentisphaeria bacterium]